MTRRDHALFTGPFALDWPIEPFPAPLQYVGYDPAAAKALELPTVRVFDAAPPSPGLTTSGAFLARPDTEHIAGGIHGKGPDFVAIGRHANFLVWGFCGSTDAMTAAGRAMLANAIVYIAGFRGHAPDDAPRTTPARDRLRVTLETLDHYDERTRDGLLRRYFAGEPPGAVRGDAEARRQWYEQVAPYLRWSAGAPNGSATGFVVDEDARTLGIPNHDIALLRECATRLDGEDAARAVRLLERYAGIALDGVAAWRSWLETHAADLAFSDELGYRFVARSALPEPMRDEPRAREEDPGVTRLGPLAAALAIEHDGSGALGVLRFSLPDGWWLLGPAADDGEPLGVRVDADCDFTARGAPDYPVARDGKLSGTFEIRVPIQGNGPGLTLRVSFQAGRGERGLPAMLDVPVHAAAR